MLLALLSKVTLSQTYEFNDQTDNNKPNKAVINGKPAVVTDDGLPWHTKKPHKFEIKQNFKGLIPFLKNKKTKLQYYIVTRELIPSIKKYLEALLKVRETKKHIIRQESCKHAKIPKYLRGKLLEFDMFIFWSAISSLNPTTLVSSDVCGYHPITKRPLLLTININFKYVSKVKSKINDQFTAVMKEVFKAIAFQKKFIQHYKHIEGDSVATIPLNKVIKIEAKGPGPGGVKIITPKVIQAARKHSNCNKLDGVLIDEDIFAKENYMEWASDHMGNEIMSSGSNLNAVISQITLSFLEDTGWYTVNYAMSEEFSFREKEGCRTFHKKCNIAEKPCAGNNIKVKKHHCFYDDTTIVSCKSKDESDYCSFMSGGNFLYEDCRRPRLFNMRVGGENSEFFGVGSRCFEGVLTFGLDKRTAFCFKASCHPNGKSIIVNAGTKSYNCNHKGQKLNLHFKNGRVNCPDPAKFCQRQLKTCPDDCNLHGRCLVNKKCFCHSNYKGNSCEVSTLKKYTLKPKPTTKPTKPKKPVTPQEENLKPIIVEKPKPVKPKQKPKPKPVVKPRPKPVAKPTMVKNSTQNIWRLDYENIYDKIEKSKCPENCQDMGKCVHGKCECIAGYSGNACQRFSAESAFGLDSPLFSSSFVIGVLVACVGLLSA